MIGASNYDMENLTAAQEWSCPCTDRTNCIGADRLNLIKLYEHRKRFQTTAAGKGGLRDANRAEMQGHYDRSASRFTRSFAVGPLGDCCAASAGLANGLSFSTWADSRADVTLERAWHAGRSQAKAKQQSEQRAHLEAYVRELRSQQEGPKGGSDPTDKWHVAKMSKPKRWEEYKKKRTAKGLPVIGSYSLFEKIWDSHTEIREFGAKGHAKCDDCGLIQVCHLQSLPPLHET
jgi:hypothetical protein